MAPFQPSPAGFRFFDLPLELRDMVYHFAAVPEERITTWALVPAHLLEDVPDDGVGGPWHITVRSPGKDREQREQAMSEHYKLLDKLASFEMLCRVNREVYNEVHDLFWWHASFAINITTEYTEESTSRTMPPSALGRIRNVIINCDRYYAMHSRSGRQAYMELHQSATIARERADPFRLTEFNYCVTPIASRRRVPSPNKVWIEEEYITAVFQRKLYVGSRMVDAKGLSVIALWKILDMAHAPDRSDAVARIIQADGKGIHQATHQQ